MGGIHEGLVVHGSMDWKVFAFLVPRSRPDWRGCAFFASKTLRCVKYTFEFVGCQNTIIHFKNNSDILFDLRIRISSFFMALLSVVGKSVALT